MLETQNRTDFETGLAPALDRDGRDHAVVVVKATFDLSTGAETPPPAEEQRPVAYVDEHAGEPGFSSVLYEMDTCLRKPGTDVFRPLSPDHANDEVFPGLLMVRTEGRMLFASAPNTTDKLWSLVNEAEPRVVLIEFSAIPDLEYTALKLLTEFEEDLSARGITLWLAALNPEPLKVIRRSPLGEKLGNERLFLNAEQAVEAWLAGHAAAQ
jgi:MFS superfamily sulfate permease-like transporter